jgi:hypothetical protein
MVQARAAIKKPHADERTSAWGFAIATKSRAFGQVFWLPCLHGGLPAAVGCSSGTRGRESSLFTCWKRAGLQRRVRTGIAPVSLFTPSGHPKANVIQFLPIPNGKGGGMSSHNDSLAKIGLGSDFRACYEERLVCSRKLKRRKALWAEAIVAPNAAKSGVGQRANPV